MLFSKYRLEFPTLGIIYICTSRYPVTLFACKNKIQVIFLGYLWDKGLLNGIIFLDLKKAFDCVDHTILIKKLKKLGCVGNTLNWFNSYLMNRKQMCKVNQTTSKFRTVSCGVLQGSNLGPILFVPYVNDSPNCLKTTTAIMFADDTNLTASCNTKP